MRSKVTKSPSAMRPARSSRTRAAVVAGAFRPHRATARARSGSRRCAPPRPRARRREERAPLVLGCSCARARGRAASRPPRRRRPRTRLSTTTTRPRGDPCELARRLGDVGEVVRGDASDSQVEAPVGEREAPRRSRSRPAASRAPGRSSRPRGRPRAAAARRGRRRSRRRSRSGSRRPTRPPGRGPAPRCAPCSSGTARRGRSTAPSCRQLHGAAGGLEHRRLDVEAGLPASPRIGGPPRRSCRRGGRRSERRCRSARARSRMPRATSSQRVMPPKMLKRIERTCGSRAITSSAATTPSAEPPPPRSQKFAGLPAGDDDHVDRRHREPGAVAEDPDGAVELHVDDASLAGERLERVGGPTSAQHGEIGVPAERRVVDRHLRVERAHDALGRHDQRVDLAERRVGLDVAAVELLDDRARSARARRRRRPAPRSSRRVVGLVALERVDVDAGERVRGSRPRPARSRPRPPW